MDGRNKRARLNIIITLLSQFVTMLCGLVVPRLMINAFGSEAYGATTSIAQFLSYVTLLEGGIAGVARAALYKPLAENDLKRISAVIYEIKRFFRIIAVAFLGYVIILAFSYKSISGVQCLDESMSFWLVVVISISLFAQYFIGISYSILIQAAQRTYITQAISIFATVLNTIFIFILIRNNCNIVIVKLLSSIIFVSRPVLMWLYVRRNYKLVPVERREKNLLDQKWTGLGQHLAYFVYSNTDIVVLTILDNLTTVAIYSVYNMVASQLQNFTSSFASGMEALFGDMIAKNEKKELNNAFEKYECLISLVSVTIFSIASVLILPFVLLYTSGVNDADYYQPIFAILLLLASMVYCLRMPYHSVIIAAGHFKQTKMAAYGEALINVFVSIILVFKFGLIGVAIGTLAASIFRFIYYVFYLQSNILHRSVMQFIKRSFVNVISYGLVLIVGNMILSFFPISTWSKWVVAGVFIGFFSLFINLISLRIFYKKYFEAIISILTDKLKNRFNNR